MAYQLSDQNVQQKDHAQLHKLLLEYCQRIGVPAEDAMTIDELRTMGNDGVQVCSISQYESSTMLGFVLHYKTYSTWEGVRLKLGIVHCSTEALNGNMFVSMMKSVIDKALDCGATRLELLQPSTDSVVCLKLENLCFKDLTISEGWHFANLPRHAMTVLANRKLKESIAIDVESQAPQHNNGINGHHGVTIRRAEASDAASIVQMIVSLAEFEKMSDQVRITKDSLVRDCFHTNSQFEFYVAMDNNNNNNDNDDAIIGFMMIFPEFNHQGKGMCIEDVFVKQQHRGKGLATAFFKCAAQRAIATHCNFMTLCYLDWNTAASDIYQHFGFVDVTEGHQLNMHYLRLVQTDYHKVL